MMKTAGTMISQTVAIKCRRLSAQFFHINARMNRSIERRSERLWGAASPIMSRSAFMP